jgi:hypothetical protein
MEEFRVGRFFRREHEQHKVTIGRVVWRQLRSERRLVPDITPRRGPYETSYDVVRGYCNDEPGV